MLEWYEAYADYDDTAKRSRGARRHRRRAGHGHDQARAGRGRHRPRAAVAPGHPARRDPRPHRPRHAARPSSRGARRRARAQAGADRGLGQARRRRPLEARRAGAGPARPSSSTIRSSCRPFAKRHRAADGLVERWEAIIGGIEIANAFTELNDPDEQRRRFEQQAEELRRGDPDAQPFDEAFLEALEQGMPPTGGVGLGIDRLVIILSGARSIREVVLFPAMRT